MLLTTQPLWITGIILVGLTTLVSMLGPIIVRRRVGLQKLSTNNEVAGFKFATVGVLYAVLLAFAVIVVWEKFSDAESDVAQEAAAAATIYRLADGVGGSGKALSEGMTRYLKGAIADDWPAMERGKASPEVTIALNGLYTEILAYQPPDARGTAIFAEILHQLDLITQARRARLVGAAGIVPGVVWMVLYGGAVVTIGFTFFFGTVNIRAQAMMTGALSLLIFSGLLIIVAIDHPFAGTVKVGTEPLSVVLEDFANRSQR
jgi:Na+/proline symporter